MLIVLVQRGWFGGDYLAIVGECECGWGQSWDNWDLRCQTSIFSGLAALGLAAILATCCGCCGAAFCLYRRITK